MIELPYDLTPDALEGIEIPDYPVQVFTSDQGIAFRSLDSCQAIDAKLELVFNSRTKGTDGCPNFYDTPDICKAWKFYRQTFGTLLSFEIPNDHPLWELLGDAAGCFLEQLDYSTWTFVEQPRWEINGVKNIWNFKMVLINKPEVNG